MQKSETQQLAFLNKLQELIPSNSTLVNELTDILDISMDSAYRRLRGQTLLTLDEIVVLCRHFNISFDSFINNNPGSVTFNYMVLRGNTDTYINYLRNLYKDLQGILAAPKPLIIYACQDIPVFHHYNYPEISGFKMFYWMKSIMNLAAYEGEQFNKEIITSELFEVGQKVYDTYNQIPSIEIWTDNTIISTLKQIEFYWGSGIFKTKEDALAVCNSLRKEITQIQRFTEGSSKKGGELKISGNEEQPNYTIYYSDIEITNNCVLVNMGPIQAVYLGHFSFNTMSTTNKVYCQETEIWLDNLLKKSVKISGISEKIRNQFFRKAYTKIEVLEQKINNPDS
jgi:hypothetical protein